MPLKMYLDPISEPCRAVMLLLETNKVKYEKVLLQILTGESVRSAIVFSSSKIYVARRRDGDRRSYILCAGIYRLILANIP